MYCRYVFALLVISPLVLSAQTHEGKVEAAHAATASSTHKPALNVVFALRPEPASMFIYVDDEPLIDLEADDVGRASNRPPTASLHFDALDSNVTTCRSRQCEGWLYEK